MPYPGFVLAFAFWIQLLIALAMFAAIAFFGLVVLRAIARTGRMEHIDPEDVTDLDVFFVCDECGTEFQVTRLGEVQVPRHCGERMSVVRRPRPAPTTG